MTIYIIILLFLIVLYGLSTFNQIKSKNLLYIGIFFLIIIASNKSYYVGTDSYNYYDYFMYVKSYSNDRIFSGLQRGWFYFNYLIYTISNYSCFLFICYSLSLCGIGYYINKLSKINLLSLLIYFLFFYLASLNVMRQYIAIGIFAMSLVYLKKREIRKYILLIIIASLFHYSALLMIPLIWIEKIPTKRSIVIITVVGTFIIGFFMNIMQPIVLSLKIITGLNEGASIYLSKWGEGERNLFTNIVINLVFLGSFLIAKNKNSIFLSMWFLFIIFNNLFGAAGQGNRLFTYLLLGMIIAVPEIIINIKNNIMLFSYTILYLTYGICYWYTILISGNGEVVPYVFR